MFILYLTLSLIQNQITTSHSGTLCSQFSPAPFCKWIVIWKTHTLYFIVPLNKVCLESGGWLRMVIWTSRSPEHNFYSKHKAVMIWNLSIRVIKVSISIESHHPFKQKYLAGLRWLKGSTTKYILSVPL